MTVYGSLRLFASVRGGEDFSALLKQFGLRVTGELARRSVQINIADLTERAGRAISEFDRNVPVKRDRIEGGRGRVERGSDLLM